MHSARIKKKGIRTCESADSVIQRKKRNMKFSIGMGGKEKGEKERIPSTVIQTMNGGACKVVGDREMSMERVDEQSYSVK